MVSGSNAHPVVVWGRDGTRSRNTSIVDQVVAGCRDATGIGILYHRNTIAFPPAFVTSRGAMGTFIDFLFSRHGRGGRNECWCV